MLRLWFCCLTALTALLLAGAAVPQPAPQRIVAVGDLHGDHDAWVAIAKAASLIDDKGHWAGGTTTLVQLGDVVDRGPDSLKIIRDLMRLQDEAQKAGGRVIAMVGNHEAMMMTGDFRYVHPGEFQAFVERKSDERRERVYQSNKEAIAASYLAKNPEMGSAAIRAEWLKTMPLGKVEYIIAWKPDGELGKWALQNPAVVKLGDTLFVHGGISAAFAGLPVDDINQRVAAALKAQDETPTAIINNAQGPLWYRGLIVRGDDNEATQAPVPAGAAAPLTIEQEIDLALNSYGVKRIVVAHTPVRSGIIQDDGGKLWRIDSAISRAYNGTPSYLEIIGDRVSAHKVTRPTSKPWSEQ